MNKILSFAALILFSAMSFAAVSITVTPSTVDFGEVSIKGKAEVEGSATISVTYSGLQPYCSVYFDDVEMPEDGAIFVIEGTNVDGLIYGGDEYNSPEGPEFTLKYIADKAGTYTGKIRFYSYADENWTVESESVYLNIKLVVTDDAVVAKTVPFERINQQSDLKNNDIVVFVSESAGAINGTYTGEYGYIPALTEGVKVDAANGKAEVPEEAQMFKATAFGGNWQFTTTDTDRRLHLDATDKGAFTFAATQAGAVFANWNVEIIGGVAVISHLNADEEQTFPIEFNTDRFKPYKNPNGTSIALYRKAGEAQEIQSKFELAAVDFGDVEQDEQKEVEVTYTAENLTDIVLWSITGADAALFDVEGDESSTGGKVKVTYKGTASKTGGVDAKLTYLTQDAKLDPLEGSVNISINLLPAVVKLTQLEFVGAPETIDQGQSVDLSQYIVFTPADAADKSLTWTVDNTYQGTVDANGVLTAKKVTGEVTVTATSVRVEEVSASVTLTITEPVITDFTLSDTLLTLHIGDTEDLTVTAFVPDYASAIASYQSTGNGVVSVSKGGKITARKLGRDTVSVTVGKIMKICAIQVVETPVESVAFAETEVELQLGLTLQLQPVILPEQAAIDNPATYTSDDDEVATVSADGLVTAVAEGKAVITVAVGGLEAAVIVHVAKAPMFTKVTSAASLGENDTIILATVYNGNALVAGPRGTDNNGKKKLSVLTDNVIVNEEEAYAEDAIRLVLGKLGNGAGFTLTVLGTNTGLAVKSDGNDIIDASSTNCFYWEFVNDGDNGVYVHNIGNPNAYFKYLPSSNAIKPYKANTSGAVYVYVYVRKYIDPMQTALETTQAVPEVRKVVREGRLLIIRNGEMYTVTGEKL